tara:strand:+ start:415 stop:771 length:357 start_codon:yes stop_codon:yes gene_type:complete
MSYTVKGTITKIGEKRELNNGAFVLDYEIEHTEQGGNNSWVTPLSFNMYKKSEYVEHIDNFIKFNKVGDIVNVEFNLKGRKSDDGRVWNSLGHWRCEKVEIEQSETVEEVEDSQDLPF